MKRIKEAKQRVVIVITDKDEESYDAEITCEPSIKSRDWSVNSPALNAGARLWETIIEHQEELAAPVQEDNFDMPTKPMIVLSGGPDIIRRRLELTDGNSPEASQGAEP